MRANLIQLRALRISITAVKQIVMQFPLVRMGQAKYQSLIAHQSSDLEEQNGDQMLSRIYTHRKPSTLDIAVNHHHRINYPATLTLQEYSAKLN